MGQQLLGLARQQGDKVVVLKVDVDRQGPMAQRAGVRSIPDTRLYYAGRELERRVGGLNSSLLNEMVLKHADKLPLPRKNKSQGLARSAGQSPKPSIIPITKSGKTARAEAQDAGPENGLESGTIVPMDKNWLPPGVTRE